MTNEQTTCTVYFDASCPLCAREMHFYKAQAGAQAVCFVDVSLLDSDLGPGLDRAQGLARLHVRDHNGRLVSGAAAFVKLWGALPRLAWLARIASLPGVLAMLEGAYRVFLIVRPQMQRLARARHKAAGSPAVTRHPSCSLEVGEGQVV